MRQEIDYRMLEGFTEEEMRVISKNIDLDLLLKPIKQNTKKYSKYTKRLGRLEKKSKLVQMNMTSIAVELFYKNDLAYGKIFERCCKRMRDGLLDCIKDYYDKEINSEKIKLYQVKDYAELLTCLSNAPSVYIDLELFFIQLKLNGVLLDEEKRKEIQSEWKNIYQLAEVKRQYRRKIESVVKEQEEIANHKIKNIKLDAKKEYEEKLNPILKENETLQNDIKVKQNLIKVILQDSAKLENDNNRLKKELIQKKQELLKVHTDCKVLSGNILELKNKLADTKGHYRENWRQEWLEEETQLLNNKQKLELQQNELKDCIEILTKEKDELINACSKAKTTLDAYTESLEVAKEQAAIEERNNLVQCYTGVAFESNLHIELGNSNVKIEACDTLNDYYANVQENLRQVGCRTSNRVWEALFNASVNAGLIPLLCGFGSRRVAMALIAAKYAEVPTIISIPNGFEHIDILEKAINEVDTETVIIEDLFGKMQENIILPILRRGTKKQLIFCSEDTLTLKYVDSYYFNYVQIINIDRIPIKSDCLFYYSDARAILSLKEYSTKSTGHKLVRYLLEESGISESFKISRGDLIEYLIGEGDLNEEKALEIWIENELNCIFTAEQKEILIERIEGNEERFGDKIVRSIR